MKPERWERVDALLSAALEHKEEQRAVFLAQVCEGDEELRAHVQALVSAHEAANSFLEAPPAGVAAALAQNDSARSTGQATIAATDASPHVFIGRTLSHYRLEELLGAGGMGVVYRAMDLKLGRAVAIKLLSNKLTADESAKVRFLREARAASALDHPNIGVIHEFGEQEGELFIVMALYEGETLKQRLEKGALNLAEAVEVLRQLAHGLEAAHRAGIVHRDIKPANVLLTRAGGVKILDFGLAKLVSDSAGQTMTQAGQAMGTVLYMSPEQLRGEAVDWRSDLWSFGVVAYEMLAGTSPFQADSSAATIARILHDEPPSLVSVPGIPRQLVGLVSQLLRKNASERPQSATQLLGLLDGTVEATPDRAKPLMRFAQIGNRKFGLLFAALVILALGSLGLYWYGRQAGRPNKINSLVVLPFVNANANPEGEYLSDGITEGLINSLSQIRELQVIARTTAFRYKGQEANFQKLRHDLSVETVLTGRVQQFPDSLVIQADLVNIGTGSQLWGERFNRKLEDISGMQEEITRSILEKLRPRLGAEEQHRVTKRETRSPEAYRLYLRGRYFFNQRSKEAMEKSVDYFQQAIAADPQYALAYAALSSAYGRLAFYQYLPHQDALAKAEAAAEKALALDEELVEAHSSLGFIKLQKWNWADAEAELKRAIALNPNDANARNEYSAYLSAIFHNEQALEQNKIGQKLDPASFIHIGNVGWLLCVMGQYERGIAALKDSLELANTAHGHYLLTKGCYARQNMYSEAFEEARRAVAIAPSSPIYLGWLGWLFARVGNKTEAFAILEKLKKWDEGADAAVSIAEVYAGLGDNDSAMDWLEKAYQRHSNWAIELKQLTGFAPLRADPRFVDLLRRMGFPD